MSDHGEKTCPLCAEEMDLTDQQLRPCKCGYEICVWCWHHIMDMAEKDETEGRCPACRTPYNKERIVETASKCERLVAEVNTERKLKSQKAKSKASEGRKQLSSVRVIQRNLVYVVGLPLILGDEDLLQRKEHFGQYGKVLKVSISRTATGAIQQFTNNTCSVYITYSKEEEAVRCIQSVHGFVLEGRSLRACFGTTKYCHAWLRNVPCSNSECLYLHEVGSQDDSFTKDEVISACTRSRVQQITGATSNIQPRSGNVLPPPTDDYCINSSGLGKPISRSAINNTASNARCSPPNSSAGGSVTLPTSASWGMRASNSQQSCASLACSNGPPKQNPETCVSVALSTAVARSTPVSLLRGDVRKNLTCNEDSCSIQCDGRLDLLESTKEYIGKDSQVTSETSTTPGVPAMFAKNNQLHKQPASTAKEVFMPNITNSFDLSEQACSISLEKELNDSSTGQIQSLFSDVSSLCIDRSLGDEHSSGIKPNSSVAGTTLTKSPRNQGLPLYSIQPKETSSLLLAEEEATSTDDIRVQRVQYDLQLDLPTQVRVHHQVEEDDVLYYSQRLKDPKVGSRTSSLHDASHSVDLLNHTSNYLPQHEAYGSNSSKMDTQIADKIFTEVLLHHAPGFSMLSNGYTQNLVGSLADFDQSSNNTYLPPNNGTREQMERFEDEAANVNNNTTADMAESSIISNILSMDFDAWDESLTSPQNLARLLGNNVRQQDYNKSSNSWKVQNSNQSRFSFARHDESRSQVFDAEPSLSNRMQVPMNCSFSHDIVGGKDSYSNRLGHCNGFPQLYVDEFDNLAAGNSQICSKSYVPRAQISAPPGFSTPNRAPPPGFTSQDRMEQAFDTFSGNHFSGNSSLLRNSYQAPPSGNSSSLSDIEFMDPAILAVGKGRLPVGLHNSGLDTRSTFSPPSSFEDEARLQLLMQRSFNPNQNLRFADGRDGFVGLNDAFGIPARNIGIMEQSAASKISALSHLSSQPSRSGLMSNSHWDGWNEVHHGDDLGLMDLLRTDRLGLNKFYPGFEDSKFRMPGNMHNRTFGI